MFPFAVAENSKRKTVKWSSEVVQPTKPLREDSIHIEDSLVTVHSQSFVKTRFWSFHSLPGFGDNRSSTEVIVLSSDDVTSDSALPVLSPRAVLKTE